MYPFSFTSIFKIQAMHLTIHISNQWNKYLIYIDQTTQVISVWFSVKWEIQLITDCQFLLELAALGMQETRCRKVSKKLLKTIQLRRAKQAEQFVSKAKYGNRYRDDLAFMEHKLRSIIVVMIPCRIIILYR